jgi:hypothetical protein
MTEGVPGEFGGFPELPTGRFAPVVEGFPYGTLDAKCFFVWVARRWGRDQERPRFLPLLEARIQLRRPIGVWVSLSTGHPEQDIPSAKINAHLIQK